MTREKGEEFTNTHSTEKETTKPLSPSLTVEEIKTFLAGHKGEPDKILISFEKGTRDYALYVFSKVYEILNTTGQDGGDVRLFHSWPGTPQKQKDNPYMRDH